MAVWTYEWIPCTGVARLPFSIFNTFWNHLTVVVLVLVAHRGKAKSVGRRRVRRIVSGRTPPKKGKKANTKHRRTFHVKYKRRAVKVFRKKRQSKPHRSEGPFAPVVVPIVVVVSVVSLPVFRILSSEQRQRGGVLCIPNLPPKAVHSRDANLHKVIFFNSRLLLFPLSLCFPTLWFRSRAPESSPEKVGKLPRDLGGGASGKTNQVK